MSPASETNGITYYKHDLVIQGYGTQKINVRIKPADKIIQDIHPELIKWADQMKEHSRPQKIPSLS